jgi:hypothetical protein
MTRTPAVYRIVAGATNSRRAGVSDVGGFILWRIVLRKFLGIGPMRTEQLRRVLSKQEWKAQILLSHCRKQYGEKDRKEHPLLHHDSIVDVQFVSDFENA